VIVTRVKICGIRRTEDAELAVALGASALGFVFWPSSPRFLEPECAARMVDGLPPFVTTVGVFVDQPVEYVADVARGLKLGAVQLHGQETPSAYADAGRRIIKAIPVADGLDAEREADAMPAGVMVLLDAHDPIKRGGTGRTIDWSRAAAIARRRPIVLSGGLDADNVREAVAAVRPAAIDVSSGVERAPGMKDPDRMRAFFAAITTRRSESD
jgi:phosphoribosylanthranilate isomerase